MDTYPFRNSLAILTTLGRCTSTHPGDVLAYRKAVSTIVLSHSTPQPSNPPPLHRLIDAIMRLLATGVPAHEDIAPAYYAAVNTVLSLRPFPSQTPREDYTLDVIDIIADSDGSDDGEQPLSEHSGPIVQPSDATLDEPTIASAARSSSNDAIQPSNSTSDALTIASASESTSDTVTQPPSSSNTWDGNIDLASFLASGNSSNLLNGASPFPFQQQTPQPIPSTWFITYVP
ncbi:unnamed protein product [Tilletia laevis]|nr:unnamed protein product [Tilletia caries]CAD6965364.1 unnamed protein product [Tilletia laevis]